MQLLAIIYNLSTAFAIAIPTFLAAGDQPDSMPIVRQRQDKTPSKDLISTKAIATLAADCSDPSGRHQVTNSIRGSTLAQALNRRSAAM